MQAGSSIMPAKVNPVVPEVVNRLLQSYRQRYHRPWPPKPVSCS
ncbi:lyase family protein [Klebsiella pneumoniae]|nr:lyase family protein [Klebsiella pneumoniae]